MVNKLIAKRDAQRARRAATAEAATLEAPEVEPDAGTGTEGAQSPGFVVLASPDAERVGTLLESDTDGLPGEDLITYDEWLALVGDETDGPAGEPALETDAAPPTVVVEDSAEPPLDPFVEEVLESFATPLVPETETSEAVPELDESEEDPELEDLDIDDLDEEEAADDLDPENDDLVGPGSPNLG